MTDASPPVATGLPASRCTPIERAIVVDDDSVIRGILRSTLAGIGLGVHLAANGEEAIAIAARIRVGLLLLDLQMPGTNGLETCRRVRALPGYADTPIVILTGHDSARTHSAALAAGATMFLTKPFKPAVLLQALAPFLTGERAPGNPAEQAGDLWGLIDPEYRNQMWGRLDVKRTAEMRARGDGSLGLD